MRRAVVAMVMGIIIIPLVSCDGPGREQEGTDKRPMTQAKGDPSPGSGPEKAPSLACISTLPEADPAEEGLFRLIPSRTEVRAGEEITITISSQQPVSILRGVDSYLECWDGKEWAIKYLLLTAVSSDSKPSAHPYPATNVAIESIGLIGPGPDAIRLPGDLRPGWYRLRKTFRLENGKSSVARTAYARLWVVP